MYAHTNTVHRFMHTSSQAWCGPCRDREDGALVKQLCRFMTCELEDGQMDDWKDGSMEGQNKKMKELRQREKDGRTGGQTHDGCTDGQMEGEDGAQIKLFYGFMA